MDDDLYDFLWAIAWDSEEVRDKAWSEWVAGPGEGWTEQVAPIVSCGASTNGVEGVYAFNAYLPLINEVADPTPERGVASYNFCTYTDDFSEGDLVTQAQQTGQFIDSLNSDYGANSSYWLALLVPTFDTPIEGSSTGEYDYALRGYWDSEEVRQEAIAFVQTLPAPSGPQPECSGDENFVFELKQDQGKSLYELKFQRFSYRWKYYDGEYSTLYPFSALYRQISLPLDPSIHTILFPGVGK